VRASIEIVRKVDDIGLTADEAVPTCWQSSIGSHPSRANRTQPRHSVGSEDCSAEKRGRFVMLRVASRLVTSVAFGLALTAAPAAAETLFIPWLAANSGGPYSSGAIEVGGSVGVTIAGVIGADFELGYAPSFFENGLHGGVVTAMGNVTIGIPFDRSQSGGIRPYVSGGLGLIRPSVELTPYGYSIADNRLGVNVGGGIMGFFGSHLGVRVDLRYLHSVDNETTAPANALDLSHLHFWRTSFGLVVR